MNMKAVKEVMPRDLKLSFCGLVLVNSEIECLKSWEFFYCSRKKLGRNVRLNVSPRFFDFFLRMSVGKYTIVLIGQIISSNGNLWYDYQ